VGSVDPVQYSVRLLLPEGSLLLDHPDLAPTGRGGVGPWDPERSTYTWASPDPEVDALQQRIAAIVESDEDPITLYARVREAAGAPPVDLSRVTTGRPRLSETWFCCAEPTELQLTRTSARGEWSEGCC
jgi:hypothetical protein